MRSLMSSKSGLDKQALTEMSLEFSGRTVSEVLISDSCERPSADVGGKKNYKE